MMRIHLPGLWLSLAAAVLATGVRAGEIGAGTAERDWIEGEPASQVPFERHRVRVTDGVRVAMRDGIELDARLFRPELPDGPGPCLLVANGYGADSAIGAAFDPWLFEVAGRGYAVLHASLRGSGKSEGTNDLYAHYGRDGHDLVEWMAAQPWCDGEVGMIGASLLGISQMLTAREAPPHLRAIAPQVACGDCYSALWYLGGMLPGPGREARASAPGVQGEYASALAHRDLDDWWRERVTLADDHRAMAARGLPILIVAGFQDYISDASMRIYREYGGPDAPRQLIVGPWAHSAGEGFVRARIVEFMDRHLRGANVGADDRPKVLIRVSGPDRWRRETDWPLPDEQRARLHLTAASTPSLPLGRIEGTLTGRSPGPSGTADVVYTPEAGPFLPVMLDQRTGRNTVDQTPWSARLPTWTSAPLPRPTEVTGYPRLALPIASSAVDADLVVALSDVSPDGSSRLVSEGYLNLPRAGDPSRPRPLRPGAVAHYELELFPLSHVFAAGHRIRLTLAGGATPAPGQEAPQGPGKHPHSFVLTIHQDGEEAWLDLPVIGVAPPQLAAGAAVGP